MQPTTWAYLASLLVIALYFKFNRIWSVRNWDLVGLILLAPALDFGGNRLHQLGPNGIDEWRRSGRLQVFHYGAGVERHVGFALYEDAAGYDAITLPTTRPTLVFQGDRDDSVDPAMVQQWALGRGLVDLRMVSDGHQLTDSMDLIWRESASFLGLVRG